ncbi:hypothetical protein SLEP1_g56856 [Rubroshorea leprosula]|uniref:Uncharacterized protein n=1 Tax=Rubroshorea leprosula TaxID=152421 RepID=A0AAV5MLW8_9ROSI|nr:hypothetical protein SLEP1_g56856 [Rubroshorea leprosula]
MLDPILSKDVLIMPCKGMLKACAMSLPDLWNSRCCLNEIEGFDHSIVNTIGACGEFRFQKRDLVCPFLSGSVELSEIFTLLEFDCSNPISPCYGQVQENSPASLQHDVTSLVHPFCWIHILDIKARTC